MSVPPPSKQGSAHQKAKKSNREEGKRERSSRESHGHSLARQGRACQALPPRAPRLTSPPTRFCRCRQGPRRSRCHGAKACSPTHALPALHPSQGRACQGRRALGCSQARIFFNLIHPPSAQQPSLHICSLTINLSITACPHPNQPQGTRDLQKRAPYTDAPGVFLRQLCILQSK